MASNINFPKINLSVSLNPTSAFPIDARTLFSDMDEMRMAAMTAVEPGSSDSSYYFGQLLTYKSPDSTEVNTYKVVNNPQYYNLLPIASLNQEQIEEIVEHVLENPNIVKIGSDVNLLTNPNPNSSLVFDSENGLKVNLAPTSGLKITEDGLEIETSDEGNVKLSKTDSGLKGEFSWNEFEIDD